MYDTYISCLSPCRSHLKYITQAETTINSTGGKLSSPDSNISVIVESGAVPEGTNQPFSFRVLYDETSLLRDIPESRDRTLISPLFHCGPESINLLKPVEIIVPHCLYLDEVKKDSISVFRCGNYSDDGNITITCSQFCPKGSNNFILKQDFMYRLVDGGATASFVSLKRGSMCVDI